MPTFDITSTFDKQEVLNAVDQMNRGSKQDDFRRYEYFCLVSENVKQ